MSHDPSETILIGFFQVPILIIIKVHTLQTNNIYLNKYFLLMS